MGRGVAMHQPDLEVRRYLTLQSRLIDGRAVAPGERVLRPKVRACRCGSRKPKRRTSTRKIAGWVCERCGRDWPVIGVVEGVTGSGPVTRGNSDLEEYADLGRALAKLRIWERAILLCYVHLGALMASKRLAEEGSSTQPLEATLATIERMRPRERAIMRACAQLLVEADLADMRRTRILAGALRRTGRSWSVRDVQHELEQARRSFEAIRAGRPRPRRRRREHRQGSDGGRDRRAAGLQ